MRNWVQVQEGQQLPPWRELQLGNIRPETLLFGKEAGVGLLSPNNVTRAWYRACRAAGLPSRLHSLRHAHASALIHEGVDVLTVSRRLGHTKASTTLDVYSHLIEGADAEAAKAIGRALKKPRGRQSGANS